MAVTLKQYIHISPEDGTAKMNLRGSSLFKNCKQTAEKCKKIKIEINYHLSNVVWIYQHGVKYAPLQCYSHFFLTFSAFCISLTCNWYWLKHMLSPHLWMEDSSQQVPWQGVCRSTHFSPHRFIPQSHPALSEIPE